MNIDDLDEFTRAYVECALWSSNDESDERGGEPMDRNYGPEDIEEESLKGMTEDCRKFQAIWGEQIDAAKVTRNSDYSNRGAAGHDFWLTRCGHGAGFWDGDWPKELGVALTEASKQAGEVWLYVGDDGQIHST